MRFVKLIFILLIVSYVTPSLAKDEPEHAKKSDWLKQSEFDAVVKLMKDDRFMPYKIVGKYEDGGIFYQGYFSPFPGDLEHYYSYWAATDGKSIKNFRYYLSKGYTEIWHQSFLDSVGTRIHQGVFLKLKSNNLEDFGNEALQDIAVYTDPAKPDTLQIKGFRYGLIAFDSDKQPYIYEEGTRLPYKINGNCIVNNEATPCQWRGFEFNYESPDEITVLECESKTDQPQNIVDPDKVIAKDVQTSHWRFLLRGKAGYYIRPQYTTDMYSDSMRSTTTCSNKGRKVLRWNLILTHEEKIKWPESLTK